MLVPSPLYAAGLNLARGCIIDLEDFCTMSNHILILHSSHINHHQSSIRGAVALRGSGSPQGRRQQSQPRDLRWQENRKNGSSCRAQHAGGTCEARRLLTHTAHAETSPRPHAKGHHGRIMGDRHNLTMGEMLTMPRSSSIITHTSQRQPPLRPFFSFFCPRLDGSLQRERFWTPQSSSRPRRRRRLR